MKRLIIQSLFIIALSLTLLQGGSEQESDVKLLQKIEAALKIIQSDIDILKARHDIYPMAIRINDKDVLIDENPTTHKIWRSDDYGKTWKEEK